MLVRLGPEGFQNDLLVTLQYEIPCNFINTLTFKAIDGIDISSEGIKLTGLYEITCKDGTNTTSVSKKKAFQIKLFILRRPQIL